MCVSSEDGDVGCDTRRHASIARLVGGVWGDGGYGCARLGRMMVVVTRGSASRGVVVGYLDWVWSGMCVSSKDDEGDCDCDTSRLASTGREKNSSKGLQGVPTQSAWSSSSSVSPAISPSLTLNKLQ